MKHVLLISIDNLRYDCIGYQPDKRELQRFDVLKYLETPTLDHIAEQSLCFTQCFSAGTYTTSSHASVLTGLYPPKHGVRAFYRTKLHRDVYSLAEIFKVYGYTTILATDTLFLFNPIDLNRGFDHVFEKDDGSLFQCIDQNRGEKIFLFAHFYDVHEPFMFSDLKGSDNRDYFKTLKALFDEHNTTFPSGVTDGSIIWKTLKEQLGQKTDILLPLFVKGVSKFDRNRFRIFIDNLRKSTLFDNGLTVIFSDHGEGKISNREPEKFTHGGDAFDNVIRIPLLVHSKDCAPGTSDKLTSTVDIFPTVLEAVLGKKTSELLPYRSDGLSLTSSEEREYVYTERWFLKMFKLHFNLSMASSILWQRTIRTKKEKFMLYGEPEWLNQADINRMDNKEFLRSVYRKLIPKFEQYDEYFKELHMLNRGEITRKQLLEKYGTERYALYDLEKDPFEENPQRSGLNPAVLKSYKDTILGISAPAVESDDIFPPLDITVVERIARHLLLDDLQESLDVITENKNLLNELIGKFFRKNEDLPDKEFLEKCYRVFLDREPEGEHFRQLMDLLREGVPRETVFMTKIFQLVEFRAVDTADISAAGQTVEPEASDRKTLEKQIFHKDREISLLRKKLRESESLLNEILSSKTWKIGQLYGKYLSRTRIHGLFEKIFSRITSSSSRHMNLHTAPSAEKRKTYGTEGADTSEGKKDIDSLPLEIMLITNYECVYNCSYCFAYKPGNDKNRRKYTAPDWEKVFRSIHDRYGKCKVVMSGGEPFFYRDFVNFVINTSRLHSIHAGTNLFLKKEVLEKIASDSNKENLYISASFHPEHEKMETFIEKMVFLRDRGVTVRANGVLHPTHLSKMIELNNRCERLSIPVGFFPFIGEFDGRRFPDGYSGQELDIIQRLPVWHQSPLDSKIRIPQTRGMLCYAGMKTIYLNPEGDVRRCMSVQEIMGKVFDGSFTLLEKPEPCPVETCDCGLYWKYHIKNSA